MVQKKTKQVTYTKRQINDMTAEAFAKVISKLKDPSLLLVAMLFGTELDKLYK